MGRAGKNSFILYDDYKQHFELLDAEDVKKLMLAVFDYHREQIIPDLPPAAAMAFSFIKNSLDRDAEAYDKVIERNRLNGLKGGRPKKNPTEPKKPTGLFGNPENPTEPKKADTDTDSVNDTDKETRANPVLDFSAPAKKKKPRATNYSEDFEHLWKFYPGGGPKKDAFKHFKACGRSADELMSDIQKEIDYRKWARGNDIFVAGWKDLFRWIRDERWNDKLARTVETDTSTASQPITDELLEEMGR